MLTPIFGTVDFGISVGRSAWIAAAVSAVGLFLLAGAGSDFERSDAAEPPKAKTGWVGEVAPPDRQEQNRLGRA